MVAIIAHRGASAYLPEHTLPAKAMAYAMNADFLEQDVVATRDDELVDRFLEGEEISVLAITDGEALLILERRDSIGPLVQSLSRSLTARGWLSTHETAYALTVHKSQGSEFDRLLLLLQIVQTVMDRPTDAPRQGSAAPFHTQQITPRPQTP